MHELSGGTFDQKFYECDEQEFHECEELSARQTRRKQHDNKARKQSLEWMRKVQEAAAKPKPGWTEQMVNRRPIYRKASGGEFGLRRVAGCRKAPSQHSLRQPRQSAVMQTFATVTVATAALIMLYCACMTCAQEHTVHQPAEIDYEGGLHQSMAFISSIASMVGLRALQQSAKRVSLVLPTLLAVMIFAGWYWQWMEWSEEATAMVSWMSVAVAAALHLKNIACTIYDSW